MRTARIRVARTVLALGCVLIGMALFPACQVDIHCPDVVAQPWWGSVHSLGVQFTGFGGRTVEGTVFRPADDTRFPGARPVIVIDHGYGEDECRQWWSAWALAGRGFVTMVFTSDPQPDQAGDTRAAIDWVFSSADSFLAQIDPTRLGLVGHSAGAEAVQVVQAADPRVKGFVNFDNLTRMSWGCPDAPGAPDGDGAFELTPRAPGLGLARDSDCDLVPETGDPEAKTFGFEAHRAAGVESGVFVLADATHGDYETDGSDVVHQRAIFAAEAWLDHYVAGDPTALDRLASDDWAGTPRSTVLSPYFRSAIATPAFACLDLRVACPPGGNGLQLVPPKTSARSSTPPAAATDLDAPQPVGPAGRGYATDQDFATGTPIATR